MKNRVKNQEKELARSREEIGRLRGELDAVQAERVRMSKALDESQVVEMRNRIQRLESDLQSSRLMVVKYQSDSARIEEETARMRKQEELVREMETLQESHAKAEEELKSIRTRLTESASRLVEMEKLQAALKESETNTNLHADRLSAADARIASLEAELEALRKSASSGTSSVSNAVAPEPSAAAPVEPDDLKRVEGIGPKLEQMLNEHGIHTFAQLKDTAVADLQTILDKGGDAFRIHDPGTWPQQAGLLAEGRIDEFEALTARLKGGREVE